MEQSTANIYQFVLNAIPDPVCFMGTDYRYIGCNQAFERVFGVDYEDLVGKTDAEIFDQARAKSFFEEDRRIIEEGFHVSKELVIDNDHGVERTYEVSKEPLRDSGGKIIGILGIAHDISERKDRENALNHAMQAASAATEAKTNFLAMIGHELRTPLCEIIGGLDLLHRSKKTESEEEVVLTATAAAESLLAIIDRLLHFSALGKRDLAVLHHNVDLRTVVADVQQQVLAKKSATGIRTQSYIADSVPDVIRCDALQIRQILYILTENAIKYTQQGEVKIELSLEQALGNGATNLAISVTDTGIGIAADMQDTIFEAFAQEDNGDARVHGGMGLGLAVANTLVSSMGGHIQLESEVGRGSCFTVLLPTHEDTAYGSLFVGANESDNLQ